MKVLLTGSTGMLGSALLKSFPGDWTIHPAGSPRSGGFDIGNRQAVLDFITHERPSVCVHTAAVVDPDLCEQNPQLARQVNFSGTQYLCEACAKVSARMVFISSDYIFSGREQKIFTEACTAYDPLQVYGRTKADAEQEVRSFADHLVLRLPILYGGNKSRDFVLSTLEKLQSGVSVPLDNEQIRYPTLVSDVAAAIVELMKMGATGTYHLSAAEAVTKYTWACRIAGFFGPFEAAPTESASSDTSSLQKAPRPVEVRLDTSKFERLGILTFKGIDEGLQYIAENVLQVKKASG